MQTVGLTATSETDLVARADLVAVVIDPDSLRDVRTLLLQGDHEGEGLVVKA